MSDGVPTDAESSEEISDPDVLTREREPLADRNEPEPVSFLRLESIRGNPSEEGGGGNLVLDLVHCTYLG